MPTPRSLFRKDGKMRAEHRAEIVAHSLLAVDYKDRDVSVMAVVEQLDRSEHGLTHCTIGTLEHAVYRAAESLGRKTGQDKWGDEVVFAPEEKKS